MSASEQLEQNGFSFSHVYTCTPCGAKYKVYVKATLPGIEVRVKFTGEVVKVFKNNRQIGVGSYSTVEKLLLNAQTA